MNPGTLSSRSGLRAWVTRSVEQTLDLGRNLAAELSPDGILLLLGDLGAGKTVLARGVAEGMGIDPREIQSPTFILIREHAQGEVKMIHVDLYRLEPEEVVSLGLEEILYLPAVKVVEWAERIPFSVPRAIRLRMKIEDGANVRKIMEIPVGGPGAENDRSASPAKGALEGGRE